MKQRVYCVASWNDTLWKYDCQLAASVGAFKNIGRPYDKTRETSIRAKEKNPPFGGCRDHLATPQAVRQ